MSIDKNDDIVNETQSNDSSEQKYSAPEVEAEQVQNDNSSTTNNNGNKSVNFNLDINFDGDSIRRVIFALCYFWEILFFIPLLMYKDAKAMRHANEGLVLLIFSVGGSIIYGILVTIFSILGLANILCLIGVIIASIIFAIYAIGLFVLKVIGIIYALTDKDQKLPILGNIVLLK